MPPAQPSLRYLTAAGVARAMPDLVTRLALAEQTMIALASGAELPPKIGVHPRPDDSFVHAMPAYWPGSDPAGHDDLVGMKWVAGFATNNALGQPAISALIVINDPMTGVPTAILDGGPITAARTAAVSGVVIRHFRRRSGNGSPPVAALIGAGAQGHSHVPVLGQVLPGVRLALFDPHTERTEALARVADGTPGIGAVRVAGDARSAIEDADVIVTAASFGPVRQVMTPDWLKPDALVVPVDYATYCSAAVAREATLFVVDQREQFLANRDAGLFDGYPEPSGTIGEALLAGTERPASGRVVATHLGVGLADVVFGAAIVRRATELGLTMVLPR